MTNPKDAALRQAREFISSEREKHREHMGRIAMQFAFEIIPEQLCEHYDAVLTSIDAALAGEGAATPALITFQPMRPIGCPRGAACSGQTISFGNGKDVNTCGLIGCQHNHNPTHGGCGVDRVYPTRAMGRGK